MPWMADLVSFLHLAICAEILQFVFIKALDLEDGFSGKLGGFDQIIYNSFFSEPSFSPGGGSIQTFSSSSFGLGGPAAVNMRSSSTSTRIVNGKKVTTKKETANGVETVTTYENGVLKSHTVNGVAQAIEGGNGGGSPRHRHALQHGHRRRHH